MRHRRRIGLPHPSLGQNRDRDLGLWRTRHGICPGIFNPQFAAISFALPLPAKLAAANIVYINTTGTNPDPTHCPGTAALPAATNGYLCAYKQFLSGATFTTAKTFAPTGVVLEFGPTSTGNATGYGSFAVTAP